MCVQLFPSVDVCLSILENILICSYCQGFYDNCNEVHLIHASSSSMFLFFLVSVFSERLSDEL